MSNTDPKQNSDPDDKEQESPKLLRTWLRENSGSGWLLGFIFEAGLIVFSVLLALAVNQWRAERAKTQEAQTALQAIHSELQENQKNFNRAMEYHREFRDTLRYYQKRDLTPPMRLLDQGVFRPATISETAWETAKQSGVMDHIDYDLVLELSSLYQRQNNYKELSSSIGQAFYISSTMRKSAEELLQEKYESWLVLLEDFSNREESFSTSNKELLKEIGQAIEK